MIDALLNFLDNAPWWVFMLIGFTSGWACCEWVIKRALRTNDLPSVIKAVRAVQEDHPPTG